MWIVRALIVIVLIVILLGFSVYNAQERVAVNILNTRYVNVPLIYVAYWAFVFGLVVTFILFATVYIRQANEIRRFRRLSENLQSEISALRNRAIDDSAEKFMQADKEKNK